MARKKAITLERMSHFMLYLKTILPTKTSELTNDSNYVSDANYVHTDTNFTQDEKNKLSGIEANADVSTIKSISINGKAISPDSNKAIDIAVPTNNNELANGAGYQTASQVESAIAAKGYQTAQDVAAAVANANHLKRKKVDALPTSEIDTNTIYMVPADIPGTNNIYTEYQYIDGQWEIMGSTEIDLSGYWSKDELEECTDADIEALFN